MAPETFSIEEIQVIQSVSELKVMQDQTLPLTMKPGLANKIATKIYTYLADTGKHIANLEGYVAKAALNEIAQEKEKMQVKETPTKETKPQKKATRKKEVSELTKGENRAEEIRRERIAQYSHLKGGAR